MGLSVLIAVLLLLVVYAVTLYNRLVRLRNIVDSSWSDIDVLLKKRYDLVDNLVQTVRGYAAHEKATLTGVAEARSRAMHAVGAGEKGRAENAFLDTLKSLLAVVEAYPDLKADRGFMELQSRLAELESGIEHARRSYNGAVRDYNNAIGVFPSNFIASRYGFAGEDYFALEEAGERAPVRVSFS